MSSQKLTKHNNLEILIVKTIIKYDYKVDIVLFYIEFTSTFLRHKWAYWLVGWLVQPTLYDLIQFLFLELW